MTKKFNGWKNYETWATNNWIENYEPNHFFKMRYFRRCAEKGKEPTYTGFLKSAPFFCNGDLSPKNSRISKKEITERLREDYKEFLENLDGYTRMVQGE